MAFAHACIGEAVQVLSRHISVLLHARGKQQDRDTLAFRPIPNATLGVEEIGHAKPAFKIPSQSGVGVNLYPIRKAYYMQPGTTLLHFIVDER
jgi:hypothetical protein